MRLLVGGDSFAQFLFEGVKESLPGAKHWAQMLAEQHSFQADSISYNGADISLTTFTATQALLKNFPNPSGQYTHMLFFVTSFDRHCIHRQKDSKSNVLKRMLNLNTLDATGHYLSKYIPDGITLNHDDNNTPYRFLTGYDRT